VPLYSDYIRNLGPGLYWPLTDGVGTVARDWSPNGRNGAYQNTPTLGVPAIAGGLDGRAVRLNGTNQFVQRATDAAFNVGTGDFAVTAWFDHRSGTTGPIFCRDTGATGNGIIIEVQNSIIPFNCYVAGTHIFYWTQGNGTPVGRSLYQTGPHHVLMTRRAGVVYSVIDGNVVLRTAAAGSVQSGGVINVGTEDGTSWFGGDMEHVAMFTKALSPQQGAEMYRLGMGQGILTRHRGR
jgi:hypothetical protein